MRPRENSPKPKWRKPKNENKSLSKKLSYDRNLNLNWKKKKHPGVYLTKIIFYFTAFAQQNWVMKFVLWWVYEEHKWLKQTKAWIFHTVGPSFRSGHLKESWRRHDDCLVCVFCVTASDLSGAVILVVIVGISHLFFEPRCNVAFKQGLNFKCPH